MFMTDSSSSSSSGMDLTTEEENKDPLGLPEELRTITDAFALVGDDQKRHKQLLFMANQLPAMDPSGFLPENKVPGCLSTVFIDGTATWNEDKENYIIDFVGESDGLLTKGLVALLVRGLSGSTAAEIQAVDPEFITEAQIGQSLTPGRNNGFLNMLAVMKKKAALLDQQARSGITNDGGAATGGEESDRPMYNAILEALKVLKPTRIELTDNSAQHAGHEGAKGFDGESHFALDIVAEAFDGLSLVNRHQLIYVLLGDIMPKIHALQIRAKTPEER
uniref:Fe-S metabolism associated domain-containing protein n=1 Tax=Cyclophora tenuis TaxID=216820 RepID=A0A7S1GMQ2_CYCTE